ncbi:hypothetical protein, partial [Leptospira santarosai]|uniref:hypothetical protein n=1 Tax=Leptospira santarosai TaxID=28183 RepID=UPI001C3FF728
DVSTIHRFYRSQSDLNSTLLPEISPISLCIVFTEFMKYHPKNEYGFSIFLTRSLAHAQMISFESIILL